MTTKLQYSPGEKEDQQATKDQDNTQEVDISLPKTERPDGPFKHSSETSGQTKAEEAENKDTEKE